jgi:hypothetical protein
MGLKRHLLTMEFALLIGDGSGSMVKPSPPASISHLGSDLAASAVGKIQLWLRGVESMEPNGVVSPWRRLVGVLPSPLEEASL